VKLNSRFKDKVDIIGLSVDFEEDISTQVIPFVKLNKVEFPIFVSGFARDEDLINYFSKDWTGALPATFIFDENSEMVRMFEGKNTLQFFLAEIKELINLK